MLKKRNIAMVMAAATVATSVAPVFAAVENQETSKDALIKRVEELLKVVYHGTTDAVYTIDATIGGVEADGGNGITTIEELKTLIAKAEIDKKALEVVVTDNGHFVENGRIVKTINAKYDVYTDATLHSELDALSSVLVTKKEFFDVYGEKIATGATTADSAKITLASGVQIELEVGDKKLDLTKGYDKLNNEFTIAAITPEFAEKVVSFKEAVVAEAPLTMPSRVVETYTYNKQATVERLVTLNVKDIYTHNGFTKDGAKIVNIFAAANNDADNKTEVVKGGKEYTIGLKHDATLAPIATAVAPSKDGGYEFKMTILVNENKANATVEEYDFVIKGESVVALNAVRTAITSTSQITADPTAVTDLSGTSRFETAINVSEKTITTDHTAGAVVLVGEEAIVDGLAAAPLAKQKNAPILLSGKDAVDADTLAEIKRVLPTTGIQTVYLVGGENVISKEVEKQLVDKLNVKIVRLAGEDRYATSIEIANKLKVDGTAGDAYVVGGEGLADAMSIAAVATGQTTATDAAPIIVSPASGLTQDAKNFLYDNKANIDNVDVIGGTSKVSAQVLKDIKDNSDSATTVERVAGETRQGTNAKVIDKYFADDTVVNIFVAKDGYVGGDGKLIDALAAAPLAGKVGAPIVLSTDGLTTEQEEALEAVINTTAPTKTVTQVGGGLASSIVSKVLELFGF